MLRASIQFNKVSNSSVFFGELPKYDNSLDDEIEKRERALQSAILKIKNRYGKNSILRGINYMEGATTKMRNQQIGGHRA